MSNPYVAEFPFMELTQEEADKLESAGLLVQSEEDPAAYDTTALVWDDLGLVEGQALRFIEAALGRAA